MRRDTLLGPDEQTKRAAQARSKVAGIDLVITGHQPVSEPEWAANRLNIDTGAGISYLDQLTLARIDVDPLQTKTFEVIDR